MTQGNETTSTGLDPRVIAWIVPVICALAQVSAYGRSWPIGIGFSVPYVFLGVAVVRRIGLQPKKTLSSILGIALVVSIAGVLAWLSPPVQGWATAVWVRPAEGDWLGGGVAMFLLGVATAPVTAITVSVLIIHELAEGVEHLLEREKAVQQRNEMSKDDQAKQLLARNLPGERGRVLLGVWLKGDQLPAWTGLRLLGPWLFV